MNIIVTKAEGVKCQRCWKVTGEGRFNFDGLCDPCCHVLLEDYADHESVPFIQAAYAEQRRSFCVS
jgi:hypothetical protein